jgi:ribosomal protein S18 acetylase RimI-like enzyme
MPDFPTFDHWFPPDQPPERRAAPAYALRHPSEDDLAALQGRLGDWSEDARARGPGRSWTRHVAGSSWLAEGESGGRPLGVLLGFTSPDHPEEAVIERIAVDPEFRRRGIGRAMVDRFALEQARIGAARVTATCRPDDRRALAFFGALGFVPDAGPGSRRLYGVPAFESWDGPGEDRVLLEREISR